MTCPDSLLCHVSDVREPRQLILGNHPTRTRPESRGGQPEDERAHEHLKPVTAGKNIVEQSWGRVVVEQPIDDHDGLGIRHRPPVGGEINHGWWPTRMEHDIPGEVPMDELAFGPHRLF